ncbi:hypothetical protein [Alistipes communis]|jgi:hypothetical protein|uniref:hypothetical protein n=2 Tax=Alistipes TaxID=239759 RepID=UPI001D072A73|nr:hypothetical protein [Alistipes communis]
MKNGGGGRRMSAAPVFLRTVPACGAPPVEEKESTDPSQRAEKPEVTIYNRPYLPPSGHSFDDGRTASAAEEYSGTPASGTLAGDDFRGRPHNGSNTCYKSIK